jgi:hypothetical protein
MADWCLFADAEQLILAGVRAIFGSVSYNDGRQLIGSV